MTTRTLIRAMLVSAGVFFIMIVLLREKLMEPGFLFFAATGVIAGLLDWVVASVLDVCWPKKSYNQLQ